MTRHGRPHDVPFHSGTHHTARRGRPHRGAAQRRLAHVEVHDEPQTLYGYQGDARPERAEVIVRREHIGRASNDIGFMRQPDGSFAAIISEYDRRSTTGAGWPGSPQAYGHAAAVRYAATHGYDIVTDDVEQDGTQRLTLRRAT